MDNKAKKEALAICWKNGYDRLDDDRLEAVEAYAKGYMAFLNAAKTERDCVSEAIFQAEAHGFKPYVRGETLKPGDKVYVQRFGKAIIFAVIGSRPIEDGVRIVAAHVDCPRLDLKPYPLYEDSELAMLKTHYYGGVKKYQWMSIPLALRGVVFLKDGSCVNVGIGDDPDEPVLAITDLLPHLSADQVKKPVSDAFTGEGLNAIIGTRPDSQEGSDRVKLHVLELLNQKYGLTEADFQSAELCLVPAGETREVGLDRSMIGGYGHDDRACSYAGMRALFDVESPLFTSVCMMADKEEIGSEGVTGMQSAFFDTFIGDLCKAQGACLSHCYENSFCLSGDVCNAYDPNFPDVSDKSNNTKLNYGVGVFKYTGRGGKGGASDASAETMARLRRLLEGEDVLWQLGELGKVDKGGGGTVACYMARRNIEVVDAGVPVLSMHSPFELVSKLDAYMTYKACLAVYKDR